MSIKRVVPNITTERLEESRKFYAELLGFEAPPDYPVEEGNLHIERVMKLKRKDKQKR